MLLHHARASCFYMRRVGWKPSNILEADPKGVHVYFLNDLPKASGSGGHPEYFPCDYADGVGDQHQRLLG
jgi:hypothetical protein